MMNKRLVVTFRETGFTVDFEKYNGTGNNSDEKLYEMFLTDKYRTLFFLGFNQPDIDASPGILFLHAISEKMIEKIAHKDDVEFTREGSDISFSEDELKEILVTVPFVLGMEYINSEWLSCVFSELRTVFAENIKEYDGTVQDFLMERKSNLTVMGRVFFHLVENKYGEAPFAFMATYSKQKGKRKVNHVPLKSALIEYKGKTEKVLELLSTVSKAVQRSEFISELVETGEIFSPLKFSAEEAYTFLREIPIYEESGIICRIPDWWKKKQSKVAVKVNIGETGKSILGEQTILSFNPRISLGDEVLTPEEIKSLLAHSEGLVFLKGKWVEVDHAKLSQALAMAEKVLEHSSDGYISVFEALKMEMKAAEIFEDTKEMIEITRGEWLKGILDSVKRPESRENIEPGKEFKAILRHYQQTGVDWLNFMINMGFGACLADDMGLGKTVQIIALLEYIRTLTGQSEPSLLVVPASLIGNWRMEMERFAPKLKCEILHGSGCEQMTEGVNVYITTYTMASKYHFLKEVEWNLLILDEAQAIKNPGTKQTKSIKELKAKSRIALTGTPVENRLTDLWSLFDFLNGGLLGTAGEFKSFIKRLNERADQYGKLRAVVSPFILRRLKTDKTVIADLPDKIEVKVYSDLTKKQVVLYKKFVDDLQETLYSSQGIERKGVVLSAIVKLKQICNHPDQYLGNNEYKENNSGKFKLLREICETVYEKRERVLVFTQFKEITEPLNDFLAEVFGREGLILHGGTAVKSRQALVERFCGEEYIPYMILSLKAGGVGLNLTKANHVIHFDRWWNPAVENQATDRAFRIGQTKNVVVHKFVTNNTIEEKIDLMIEEKMKLADDVIGKSGEGWITEMSNEELVDMFRMAGDI